jgi:hypothetical protein
MKILSIIGILFSLIGIIISILILAAGFGAVGSATMYLQDATSDYAAMIFIVSSILILINLFFFAFSIASTIKNFRKIK